jgi:hypothetical protein
MKTTTLTMIEADEGKVLVKDGTYSKSVLLRKGETADGWTEITEEEYNDIMIEENEE